MTGRRELDARFRLPADVNLNLEYAQRVEVQYIEDDDPISDDIIFAEFSRRANVFSFEARYIDIGENFDVETGFIPRTDREVSSLPPRTISSTRGWYNACAARAYMTACITMRESSDQRTLSDSWVDRS